MIKQDIKNYEEAVAYLYDMPRFTSKNTIEDTEKFLKKLGNPEKKMRIIHVAGTNGKGSVCTYMRSVLEEAGYSVSIFTSPHLVDIRERFVSRGKEVSKETFFETFIKIYEMLDWNALVEDKGYHPTFFEYLFFMAMLIFEDERTDFCILETGLGGRLDATNSVSVKEISVITRISLDHVQYLGDTVGKIAFEKSGIMKPQVPVIYIDSSKEATEILQKRINELGIKGYSVSNADYAFLKINNKNIDFSLNTRYYGYVGLEIATIAKYQMENAALAVRSLEVLDSGRTITKEAIINGVKKAFWQGRMEEVLPDIFVDGAHNEDGVRAFLDTVSDDGLFGNRLLLFGAVADKDTAKMISRIVSSGLFSKIVITGLRTGRSADTVLLAQEFRAQGFDNLTLCDESSLALKELIAERKHGERIYIAGSLYLVGEIKEFLIDDQF